MAVAEHTRTRDLKTPSILVRAIAAATVILAVRSPHQGGYGTCWILSLTGYQCPTCGGLRAVHDLAHLDLAGAWAMNPLVTLTLPVIGVAILGWWFRAWRGYRALTIPSAVVIIGAIVTVAFGVLRNL